MQAIILAAGMGKRLGEYTKENTKCMLPVNGERLIDRMLGQLSQLDLARVVIVVGYQADNLIRHIGHRYDGATTSTTRPTTSSRSRWPRTSSWRTTRCSLSRT